VSLIQEMKANRVRSLEAASLEADLLRRNLQPHFLMNSLMLVIEWIEQKPQAAVNFVQALAEELRALVKFSNQKEVSLEEEIALCRRHLEIMAYRYNAEYHLNVCGSPLGIRIPPAILHTQIENAYSHNHLASGSEFTLEIKHESNNVALYLCSPINRKQKIEGMGMGERYIHSRLKQYFGQDYRFESGVLEDRWQTIIAFKEFK